MSLKFDCVQVRTRILNKILGIRHHRKAIPILNKLQDIHRLIPAEIHQVNTVRECYSNRFKLWQLFVHRPLLPFFFFYRSRIYTSTRCSAIRRSATASWSRIRRSTSSRSTRNVRVRLWGRSYAG